MSQFVQPTKFTGFDLESIEWWDFHPETEESKSLKLSFPMLEIGFKSGKVKRIYGNTANTISEMLFHAALLLYEDQQR